MNIHYECMQKILELEEKIKILSKRVCQCSCHTMGIKLYTQGVDGRAETCCKCKD